MEKHQEPLSKYLLWVGITANLFFLGFYKYTDFFISIVNSFGTNIEPLHLSLPLAISFLTFLQIAYLVDTYVGVIAKDKDALSYGVFAIFFPHLLAGPIVHHGEIIPQFSEEKAFKPNLRNVVIGICFILCGLAKKSVIADNLSPIVNAMFEADSLREMQLGLRLTFIESWVGAISYTFQLYFDFSGYTDIAIGSAFLFNISMPINFNSPLKSTSIIEFWQRWHITLSRFITSYVFDPMARAFQNPNIPKIMLCLFITMTLAGLWHGAGWTFIVFGMWHGGALAINHFWRLLNWKMPAPIAWLLTFITVVTGLVFFRAPSLTSAIHVLEGMYGMNDINLPRYLASEALQKKLQVFKFLIFDDRWMRNNFFKREFIPVLGVLLIFTLLARNSNKIKDLKFTSGKAFYYAGIGIMAIVGLTSVPNSEFLYFNF